MAGASLDSKYPVKVVKQLSCACVLRSWMPCVTCCAARACHAVSFKGLTAALPCGEQVLYCGACTNPPEFCAWTGAKVGVVDDACKAWLLANEPDMAAKFGYGGEGGEAAAAGGDGEAGKPMPGGKKKKEAVKEVLVSSKQRQKKKFVCTVRGLETFGVKLPDACKVFKKKFSTGASVTETPDQKEEIEIQVTSLPSSPSA